MRIAPRTGSVLLYDKPSTHLFTTTEADGRFFAHPTIFQNEDGGWVNMDWNHPHHVEGDPFEEAIRRNELFEFATAEEAEAFA